LAAYHSTVWANPSSKEISGAQPSCWRSLDESNRYLRSCPGRSGTISLSESGLPKVASTRSAISMMEASTPLPTWYVSPTLPRASTASIAVQWSNTCSHSRRFSVVAYRVRFLSSRAEVVNTGMTFSGNWYGP
jgi:hypothetical protein